MLKLLLEKVCTALTNIPEEAIFPLIDFSGNNVKKDSLVTFVPLLLLIERLFVIISLFTASESSLKNVELSETENLGTKVAVRYGVQLKLLQSTTDGVEDLTYLLKYCKFFLQGQQRATDVTLRILVESKTFMLLANLSLQLIQSDRVKSLT